MATAVHQRRRRESLKRTKLKLVTMLGAAMIANVGSAVGANGLNARPTDQQASGTAGSNLEDLERFRLLIRKSVHFELGKSDLSPAEKASLCSLAKRFGRTKQAVIELRGYADGAGSTEQDVALSTERAQVIQEFLIERGIPTDRILVLGLGAVDPAGPTLHPEHQRVDLRIFMQATDDLSLRGAVVSKVVAKGTSGAK
jgi:outer membrane protein OmpA-like peptidoglycan-associated protein